MPLPDVTQQLENVSDFLDTVAQTPEPAFTDRAPTPEEKLIRIAKYASMALCQIAELLDGTFKPGDGSYVEEASEVAATHTVLWQRLEQVQEQIYKRKVLFGE